MRGWILSGLAVLAVACSHPGAGDADARVGTGSSPPPSIGRAESDGPADGAVGRQDYLLRTAHALAQLDSPRELALAALLRQAATRSSPPQPGDVIDANRTRVQFDGLAREWRQRAATRAGDDVIANVLLIMGASKVDAVSQAAARRWADAQPDNSAPLLLSTDLPVDGVLQAAAARHYDSAYLPTLRWIRDALSAYPADAQIRPSAGDAETMTEHVHATMLALELSTGNAISAYSRIVGSCRADAPEVQTACRSVARQLLDADTVLARDWGRALMTQLVGPDGEAARKSAWTTHVMQRATAEHRELQYTRLLDDASIRTEIDLQARILSDAGLALAPPADWMPATP